MSVQVHRGGGKPSSRRGCRICKFAFSIEIPQSLTGGTQWSMTSSAGCPEPPCRPTSSRGLHGLNQHVSIGFCAYLPNHDFSRRIRSIDSSVAAPRAFSPTSTSTPNLRNKTSHFSRLCTLLETTPSTHKLTHTMPRQRSAGRAPSRPTVPSRAPAAPTSQQQTRPATSYAAPATQTPHQPAPTSQGPGLFGQMASTAAYV